jgi:UDP-2,3-diacylglucosamine pyrophosphatase LpxH
MKEAENNDSDLDREPRKYRALFLSDLHLGTKTAQVDALLEFLKHHDADVIYLVGDIVDGWRHALIVVLAAGAQRRGAEAFAQGAQGARIVYVPGNHDEFLRDFYGTHFGGIEVIARPRCM